jgi:hypothetical protein
MASKKKCPHCRTAFKKETDAPVFCKQCHHRADVPVEQCDCPMCYPTLFPNAVVQPEDLADLGEIPDVVGPAALPDLPTDLSPPLDPAEGIQVISRFFREPVAMMIRRGEKVVIHVEEERDPSKWMEIQIPEEKIGEWWKELCL